MQFLNESVSIFFTFFKSNVSNELHSEKALCPIFSTSLKFISLNEEQVANANCLISFTPFKSIDFNWWLKAKALSEITFILDGSVGKCRGNL